MKYCMIYCALLVGATQIMYGAEVPQRTPKICISNGLAPRISTGGVSPAVEISLRAPVTHQLLSADGVITSQTEETVSFVLYAGETQVLPDLTMLSANSQLGVKVYYESSWGLSRAIRANTPDISLTRLRAEQAQTGDRDCCVKVHWVDEISDSVAKDSVGFVNTMGLPVLPISRIDEAAADTEYTWPCAYFPVLVREFKLLAKDSEKRLMFERLFIADNDREWALPIKQSMGQTLAENAAYYVGLRETYRDLRRRMFRLKVGYTVYDVNLMRGLLLDSIVGAGAVQEQARHLVVRTAEYLIEGIRDDERKERERKEREDAQKKTTYGTAYAAAVAYVVGASGEKEKEKN